MKTIFGANRVVPNTRTSLKSIKQRYVSGDGLNIGGKEIAEVLDGTTTQSTKITNAIRDGKIRVSVLGDELFERALGEGTDTVALAIGDKLYLRKSSSSIFSDSVHEGTHVLDYLDGFGVGGTKTRWQWEKRAYHYEQQYQKAIGTTPEFNSTNDMLMHIWMEYKNEIYNPY